jgi:16S rRNA (uracil1498-N3)-methyltransferase
MVSIFDGRGHEFLAKILAAGRRDVRVQLLSRVEPAVEAAVPLTLVQAVLKGDKMDDIVRDAVMLGVAAIQPIVTTRTEVTVAALVRGGRVDRWKRVALASVKQSRRAVVPEIRGPLTFESWLDEPRAAATLMLVEPRAAATLMLVEPGAAATPMLVEPRAAATLMPVEPGASIQAESLSSVREERVPSDAAIVVGPEGGWSDAECGAAQRRGVRLVTLGHRTLRADAVPVAAVSVLQFLWGDL